MLPARTRQGKPRACGDLTQALALWQDRLALTPGGPYNATWS